jgi:hypothetical protein
MPGTDMVQVKHTELREHPMGHEGIMASLREVAKMISEGRLHEDVISWSGHRLVEAGSPSGNLSRAKALFEAFAKQYAYMHDQRGVERMAGAHLTLGNGKDKKPRLPGGDCDDAVVAYGSACEAAGIPTAVVGASYNQGGDIEHVLLMVSDGNGRWIYADPSAKGYTFGQHKTPTRELIIDTLTGETLCDGVSCSPRMAGRILNDDAKGSHFLSLNGVETYDLGIEPAEAPLGVLRGLALASELVPEDVEFVQDRLAQMRGALDGLVEAATVASEVLTMLGSPPLGSDKNMIVGPAEYQRAVNLEAMLALGITALDEVLAGSRTIGLVEGAFGVDLVVESLPTDLLYVGFDLKKRAPELYKVADHTPVNAPGQLGAFPILGVAIAVAVITFSTASAVIADAWASTEKVKAQAAQATAQAEFELIKAGKEKELARVYEARRKLAAVESKGTPGGQVAEASKGIAEVLKWVALIALGAGGAVLARRLLAR